MSNSDEPSAKEEEQLIEQVAQKIHQYGMETPAIFFLESSKPLVWVGGEMGRFFITPFMPILGDNMGVKSEKFLIVFEKRENIEKLIIRLEELVNNGDDKNRSKVEENKASEETQVQPTSETETTIPSHDAKKEKRGWRRFLP